MLLREKINWELLDLVEFIEKFYKNRFRRVVRLNFDKCVVVYGMKSKY